MIRNWWRCATLFFAVVASLLVATPAQADDVTVGGGPNGTPTCASQGFAIDLVLRASDGLQRYGRLVNNQTGAEVDKQKLVKSSYVALRYDGELKGGETYSFSVYVATFTADGALVGDVMTRELEFTLNDDTACDEEVAKAEAQQVQSNIETADGLPPAFMDTVAEEADVPGMLGSVGPMIGYGLGGGLLILLVAALLMRRRRA